MMLRSGWICYVVILLAGSAQAGVVVFGNGAVLVTISQTEKDGQLLVKTSSGDATFALEHVAWFSKDASVDSLWAAAQAATKDGKSNVAAILAQEASFREPANAGAAKQMVAQYETRMEESRRAAPPAPAAQPGESPGGVASIPGAESVKGALNQPGSPEGTAEAPSAQTEPAEIGAHGWPVESSAISAEDLRVNAIVIGVFGLVLLFTVWKMTASEG